MARRGKYGAEKRQKELKKQKKRAEKLERKRLKKQDDPPTETEEGRDGQVEARASVVETDGERNDGDKA